MCETVLSDQEKDVLQRLQSQDSAVVRAAAFEAGDFGIKNAVELLARHFENNSIGVQEAAEYALRKIRGPKVVEAMVPLLRSENVTMRNIAMDVLREIGVDNMACLTHALQDADPDIRIFASDILGSSCSSMALAPLCHALLHDPEVNVRYQAAISLGSLGSVTAADSLRLAIEDEEWVQFAVIEALAKIRDESCVDILIQALENSSDLVASTILDALGEMNNVRAVPLLLAYLDKSSGPLRTKALRAVIRILGPNVLSLLGGKQLSALHAYMLAAIHDDDEETLAVVLKGLPYTGVSPESTKAVLDLVARTDPDKQPELLEQALQCLVGIGYNQALEEALQSKQEMVRRLAVEACGLTGDRAGKFAIKRHFNTLDSVDKRRAMEYLAQKGDDRDISFFIKHLDTEEDPDVLCFVLHFLGQTIKYVEAAPRMLPLLEHPSERVQEAALEACLTLGDESTIQAIVNLYSEDKVVLRKMSVITMGYVGAQHFAEALTQAMGDADMEVRRVALQAIGFGWELSQEKLHIFEIAIQDTSREVRMTVVECLGQDVNEYTVPLLVYALEDEEDWVRVRAMEALGANRVVEAAPVLVQMLEHSSLLVQLKAIEALGSIGDDVAFRSLLGYMSHESEEIQSAAATAIARIRNEEGGRA